MIGEKLCYTNDSLQSMNLVETMINVTVKDLFIHNDKQFVILDSSQFLKINKFKLDFLRKKFKKGMKLIKFDDDLTRFINNLLYPIKVNVVNEDNNIFIEPEDKTYKGILIGKNGDNLDFFKKVVSRYFSFNKFIVR